MSTCSKYPCIASLISLTATISLPCVSCSHWQMPSKSHRDELPAIRLQVPAANPFGGAGDTGSPNRLDSEAN
jgi:hypothetical protein